MGHLFRMLNFSKFLKEKKQKYIFVVNNNENLKSILVSNSVSFQAVDFKDLKSNWEKKIILRFKINYWVNDRLDTNKQHAFNICETGVKLITLDDYGDGAKLSDLSIYGLPKKRCFKGKKIITGLNYLILNNDIDIYKLHRTKLEKILVTLGGSDTHGVTIKILKILKKHFINATIHVGPSFSHYKELEKEITKNYKILNNIPSLIEEFSKYDLAITGGGITPFEANASGLPCLIIANECHEKKNALFLEKIETSKFIGHYKNIDETIFSNVENLNLKSMSKNGIEKFNTIAVQEIYKEIMS